MKLYRIILVDDEEEVRKSIIRKIKWEENGFLVAGDAENGEDALEKIEALEPDLILTACAPEIPVYEDRYFLWLR